MTNAVERMYKEYGARLLPFTAEKQIELIKFLGNTLLYDELGKELKYWIGVHKFSLEDALAIITSDYIAKLDTAKVKEILEG